MKYKLLTMSVQRIERAHKNHLSEFCDNRIRRLRQCIDRGKPCFLLFCAKHLIVNTFRLASREERGRRKLAGALFPDGWVADARSKSPAGPPPAVFDNGLEAGRLHLVIAITRLSSRGATGFKVVQEWQ
jgi:hypothetical protein